ncbi:unnamed protein product [Vitrella brassicaformis CCMP3155]|uniref:Uncharacterized protein n=1 Tax=Vitrella brassicaformis (strain CCMP3155) TaxID=1169540 RepID=A0A0G4GDT6_VITBC|nr:unnamed protein product [Vitrella brassicaformis CCMP3155]|eukprot:CEM27485.1 unnamed protein product [Vitrella brassicaformis CCMP3155]
MEGFGPKMSSSNGENKTDSAADTASTSPPTPSQAPVEDLLQFHQRFQYAVGQMNEGRWAVALACFDFLTELASSFPQLDSNQVAMCFACQALCALSVGRLDDAHAAAVKAKALDPEYEKTHEFKAFIELRQGKHEEAIKTLRSGLDWVAEKRRLEELLALFESCSKVVASEAILQPDGIRLEDAPSAKLASDTKARIFESYETFRAYEQKFFDDLNCVDMKRLVGIPFWEALDEEHDVPATTADQSLAGDFLFVLLGLKPCALIGYGQWVDGAGKVVDGVFRPVLERLGQLDGVELEMHLLEHYLCTTYCTSPYNMWVLVNRKHPRHDHVRHTFFHAFDPSLPSLPEEAIQLALDYPTSVEPLVPNTKRFRVTYFAKRLEGKEHPAMKPPLVKHDKRGILGSLVALFRCRKRRVGEVPMERMKVAEYFYNEGEEEKAAWHFRLYGAAVEGYMQMSREVTEATDPMRISGKREE